MFLFFLSPTFFGDNQSVVTNSTLPQSQLNKRHQALAYHKVREAVASGMIGFYHIPGEKNPADILSKHWGNQQDWPLLKPLLFWIGETKDIPDKVATQLSANFRGQDRGECYNSALWGTVSSVSHLATANHINSAIWKLEFPIKHKRD